MLVGDQNSFNEPQVKDEQFTELAVSKAELSDATQINGLTWAHIKQMFQNETCTRKSFLMTLNQQEKSILQALEQAQIQQGDMDELKQEIESEHEDEPMNENLNEAER